MKKIITLSVAAFISVGVFAQWDTLHTNTTANFNSICFKDENNGVAVGKDTVTSRGIAFYTTDGGLTWSQSLNTSNAPSYNDIAYSSLGLGYVAVTDSGSLLQSFNGTGFTRTVQLGTENFNTVFLVENTNSVTYIGGDNGVLYRMVNSNPADTLNSGTTLSINDIYFADAANGWIVGNGGYMAATSDSGNTWTTITEPFFGFFNCSGFAYVGSTADVFAVGNSGDMIHSSNGGLNWNAFSSNTTYNLNSIRFTNDLAGIVVGDYGKILRTQDGGTTWWDESMPYVTKKLTGISWASDTLAYICGSKGRILKSHTDISAVHTVIENGFEISTFPNPFADELNIVIDLQKISRVQISVMDVTGRIVLEENEGELNSGKQIIHPAGISSLVSGMYFVKVISGNGEMTVPVIKQ